MPPQQGLPLRLLSPTYSHCDYGLAFGMVAMLPPGEQTNLVAEEQVLQVMLPLLHNTKLLWLLVRTAAPKYASLMSAGPPMCNYSAARQNPVLPRMVMLLLEQLLSGPVERKFAEWFSKMLTKSQGSPMCTRVV